MNKDSQKTTNSLIDTVVEEKADKCTSAIIEIIKTLQGKEIGLNSPIEFEKELLDIYYFIKELPIYNDIHSMKEKQKHIDALSIHNKMQGAKLVFETLMKALFNDNEIECVSTMASLTPIILWGLGHDEIIEGKYKYKSNIIM